MSINDEKSMKKTISPEKNMMLTNRGHTEIQFRKEQHLTKIPECSDRWKGRSQMSGAGTQEWSHLRGKEGQV